MASNKDGRGVGKAALAIALIAPGIAIAAAVAIRVLPGPRTLPFEMGVMTLGQIAAGIGALCALAALVHALGDLKRRGFYTLLAVLTAGAAAGLYWKQDMAVAAGLPADVSTNPSDPPPNLANVGATSAACDGLTPIPSQVASEQVSEALQNVGFSIDRAGLFGVEGSRRAYWFREAQDVAVRIRPGRTDIRVVGRDAKYDGGAACRLALRVRAAIQTTR